MTDTQVTWLTEEAFERLKAELDQLIANRPVIAAEINDRREEGDLRENGGYHAARDEQGQQEARIRQLQDLLSLAKVGEAPKKSGVALPGSVVTVFYDGDEKDTELLEFTRENVEHGQEVFLKYGLMEHGSLWGHGAYLGPDYSAEYLHRLAEIAGDTLALERHGKSYAALAPDDAALSQWPRLCSLWLQGLGMLDRKAP